MTYYAYIYSKRGSSSNKRNFLKKLCYKNNTITLKVNNNN